MPSKPARPWRRASTPSRASSVSLRRGGGYDTLDPLSGAGDLLSTGQTELTTAMRALNAATS